jgi:amidase
MCVAPQDESCATVRRPYNGYRSVGAGHGLPVTVEHVPDICLLSATELTRRIRDRDLSAREVLEAHVAQIERVNPKVNAIVTATFELACERARLADEAAARGEFFGPLHGLPVVHKDLEETKGIRTTYGSPIFADYVPDFDTPIVERIRAAGAVLIGKTNTPEFGAGSQTFNPVFGATRNPWDLTKTCGGSSGGAAVALACGMVPIADGSDMGGSLRNPASFCSVVGFRSSPGRVPRLVPSELSVNGPMARNVEDCALFFKAIADHDPEFETPLERDFRGARIAWCPDFAGLPFDSRVREVFATARALFEELGCIVQDADPDFAGADQAFRVLRAAAFYEHRGRLLASHRHEMKQPVVDELERGAQLTMFKVAQANETRSRLIARIATFMQEHEYLVLPTVQVPPFSVDEPWAQEIGGIRMKDYIEWMGSCYFISVTGHPAISVPAGFTRDGLPVGVQIVGRALADWSVLQLARAFEQARPDLGRPPIC